LLQIPLQMQQKGDGRRSDSEVRPPAKSLQVQAERGTEWLRRKPAAGCKFAAKAASKPVAR
jgi:hypothetical protein